MTATRADRVPHGTAKSFARTARKLGVRRRVVRSLEPAARELFPEDPTVVLASRPAFEEAAMHAVVCDAGNLELSFRLVDALASTVEGLGLARTSDVPDPFRRVWVCNRAGARKRGVVVRRSASEVAVLCPPSQDNFTGAGHVLQLVYRGWSSSVEFELSLNDAVRLPDALVLHLSRPGGAGAIGRDDVRLPVQLLGQLRAVGVDLDEEWAAPRPCRILDVSSGGLRVASELPFGVGQPVEVELELLDGMEQSVALQATICWNRIDDAGDRTQGLQLVDHGGPSALRYERFLHALLADEEIAPEPSAAEDTTPAAFSDAAQEDAPSTRSGRTAQDASTTGTERDAPRAPSEAPDESAPPAMFAAAEVSAPPAMSGTTKEQPSAELPASAAEAAACEPADAAHEAGPPARSAAEGDPSPETFAGMAEQGAAAAGVSVQDLMRMLENGVGEPRSADDGTRTRELAAAVRALREHVNGLASVLSGSVVEPPEVFLSPEAPRADLATARVSLERARAHRDELARELDERLQSERAMIERRRDELQSTRAAFDAWSAQKDVLSAEAERLARELEQGEDERLQRTLDGLRAEIAEREADLTRARAEHVMERARDARRAGRIEELSAQLRDAEQEVTRAVRAVEQLEEDAPDADR